MGTIADYLLKTGKVTLVEKEKWRLNNNGDCDTDEIEGQVYRLTRTNSFSDCYLHVFYLSFGLRPNSRTIRRQNPGFDYCFLSGPPSSGLVRSSWWTGASASRSVSNMPFSLAIRGSMFCWISRSEFSFRKSANCGLTSFALSISGCSLHSICVAVIISRT